jgi:hypothetical protein
VDLVDLRADAADDIVRARERDFVEESEVVVDQAAGAVAEERAIPGRSILPQESEATGRLHVADEGAVEVAADQADTATAGSGR